MHTPKQVFALVDGNWFYVACELVFRPELLGKPVVVLSNNDGMPIAQNLEARKLLAPYKGEPWFKIKPIADQLGIIAFSSNYELYGDMSDRFVQVLKQFAPRVEVYSIDESFLDLTGMNKNLVSYGQEIKNTVKQWIGLPTCVGIGHTKTLAKLANHCAKKQDQWQGVCDFTALSEAEANDLMANLEVSKIWGVGSRLEAKLNALGVRNALALKRADPKRIRDQFGVILERTVRELNGEVLLEIDEVGKDSKQVMSSRSFGVKVTDKETLEASLSYHARNTTERMRKQSLYANAVYVFIQSSPFDGTPFYGPSQTIGLPAPSNDSMQIAKVAAWALKQMFKPGISYHKCGVMLMNLVPADGQQTDLFGFSESKPKSEDLMAVMDLINNKYTRHTMKIGSEGMSRNWEMRRGLKSPNYTTDFREIPVIN